MRYKTSKNLAKATEMIMAKGYDRDTAAYVASHLFGIVRRHNQSVEEMIQKLEPKENRK